MSGRTAPSGADLAVVAACQERGVTVSARQMERWRAAGLLLSNTRQGQGRGRGTTSEPAPDTVERVTVIAQHVRRGQPLKAVGVHLFAHGYEIRDSALRDALCWLFDDMEKSLSKQAAELASRRTGSPDATAKPPEEDEEVADSELWAEALGAAAANSTSPWAQEIRTRIKDRREDFAEPGMRPEPVRSIATSVFTAVMNAAFGAGEPHPDSLREVVEAVGAMAGARDYLDKEQPPFTPTQILSTWHDVLCEVSLARLRQAAYETPPQQLYALRAAVLELRDQIQPLVENPRKQGLPEAYGLGPLVDAFRDMSDQTLAMMVVGLTITVPNALAT